MEIIANSVATVIYALAFVLFFARRAYYIGWCMFFALVGGAAGLVLAPAFWLPVELVIMITDSFALRSKRVARS